MIPSERRHQERTRVKTQVKIRSKNSKESDQLAVTRDLSSTGVFLYSESAMEPGTKLELVIMLPGGLGMGPGGWTLCQASVLRVEESEGKGVGVAATLDRIELLPELI